MDTSLRTGTRKPLLAALAGTATAPPPVWLMRQAGRYLPEYRDLRARARDFLDFCYTPELAIEASLQPVRRFAVDAAILFSDILVVPDALGQKVAFIEGEGPVLEAVADAADLARLTMTRLEEHLAPVYEAVAGVKAGLPAGVALIGFAGAPWTLATYMVEGRGGSDFARARRFAYAEPGAFARLIELLVEATSAHLIRQAAAGAEVVQLFDSWAGVLSEAQFRRLSIEPTRAIVANVRAAHPGVRVIGFPRGAGALYRDYATDTGVDAVGIDQAVPLAWARDVLQPVAAVQGNLDNAALLAGGAALDEEVARILAALAGGPFVFNLGHGVLPATPPAHVERLIERVRGARP